MRKMKTTKTMSRRATARRLVGRESRGRSIEEAALAAAAEATRATDRALGIISPAHARTAGRRSDEARAGPAAAPSPADVRRVNSLRRAGKTFVQIDREMGRPDRHGAWSWTILNSKKKLPRKKR